MDLSPSELQDEFGRLDRNGGGMVMFEEFCTWMGEVQAAALGWGELVSLFNRQAAQAEARKSDADIDASLSRAERRSLRWRDGADQRRPASPRSRPEPMRLVAPVRPRVERARSVSPRRRSPSPRTSLAVDALVSGRPVPVSSARKSPARTGAADAQAPKLVVVTDQAPVGGLMLRSSPDAHGEKLGPLQPGDTASALQYTRDGEWVQLAPAVSWDGGELLIPTGWARAPTGLSGLSGLSAVLEAVRGTPTPRARSTPRRRVTPAQEAAHVSSSSRGVAFGSATPQRPKSATRQRKSPEAPASDTPGAVSAVDALVSGRPVPSAEDSGQPKRVIEPAAERSGQRKPARDGHDIEAYSQYLESGPSPSKAAEPPKPRRETLAERERARARADGARLAMQLDPLKRVQPEPEPEPEARRKKKSEGKRSSTAPEPDTQSCCSGSGAQSPEPKVAAEPQAAAVSAYQSYLEGGPSPPRSSTVREPAGPRLSGSPPANRAPAPAAKRQLQPQPQPQPEPQPQPRPSRAKGQGQSQARALRSRSDNRSAGGAQRAAQADSDRARSRPRAKKAAPTSSSRRHSPEPAPDRPEDTSPVHRADRGSASRKARRSDRARRSPESAAPRHSGGKRSSTSKP